MNFPQHYWTNMDRDAYYQNFADLGSNSTPSYFGKGMDIAKKNDNVFPTKDIGSSRWLDGQNKNPIRAVMADIRAGAGHIELTAPGTGRGGPQSTFEEIDAQQREELREIQKAVDDVSITTHATPAIWGMSGYNPQAQGFSEQSRRNGIDEIKKAIDFSADATFGGSVVIHTGEFQRPLHNIPGKNGTFKMHDAEIEEAGSGVVDSVQNRFLGEINDKQPINITFTDDEGNVKLRDDISNLSTYIKNEVLQNDDLRREVKDYVKKWGGDVNNLSEQDALVREIGAKIYVEQEQYERQLKDQVNSIESNKLQLQRFMNQSSGSERDLYASQIEQLEKQKLQLQAENERRREGLKTLREHALNKSYDSYSDLGMYAYEQSKKLKDAEGGKFKDRVKPITITLENIYPDAGMSSYGSDADELIDLVQNSRKAMAKKLENSGLDTSKAKKLSEQHIQATFDTGHFNMWRKYFKKKPGESEQSRDKRFNKWYLDQVQKLADSGIVGNVHLADNFGYDDTHLSPGEGNAPIRDSVEILKKAGYDKKTIVEGGFNQGKTGFHDAWRYLGNQAVRPNNWTNVGATFGSVRNEYHFHRQSPYFVFGKYSPEGSEDWRPWSGTNME